MICPARSVIIQAIPWGGHDAVMTRQGRVVYAPIGAEYFDRLYERIELARAAEPLVPITVVVPSLYSGFFVRRNSGRRLPAGGLTALALAQHATFWDTTRCCAAAGSVPTPSASRRHAATRLRSRSAA